MENIYCRFCAKPKNSEKLLNLGEDAKKLNETLTKLSFLNAVYVDFANSESDLPKTVCFVCYDSLNRSYEFLYNVKNAQQVLVSLFSGNNEANKEVSDDDRTTGYDDFGADDIIEAATEVKNEIFVEESLNNPSILVKKELKEEIDVTLFQTTPKEGHSNNIYDTSLNVCDILDAAINANSLQPNVAIYAKELTNLCKRTVKSWNDYPWICSYCSIEFLDFETLQSHSKVVHGKCAAFTCVDCKEFNGSFIESPNENGFKSFNCFINHVRKHKKGLRNRCHYCDILISKSESLNEHVKSHFQKSQLPCYHCGEILKNEDVLQKHLSEYQNVRPKRKPRRKQGQPITIDELTCKHCQKVYKNPNSLRDHMKLHVKDRKRDYTCERCGKTFFNKGTLTSHIMSHDKVRPHHCRICDKSFLFPNMLRRHVLMHSNVKPFSCEQCGRCFRLQYQLNSHKIIHTDAMPYVCQYCNKAFRFKQILKNHERQHTGSKPYSCQPCSLEFTNWSNYNKHMKRRHNTDTSKKKITPNGVFPVNPETGQIMQLEDPVRAEEWKSKIMTPGKRGKKKVVKEDLDG